MRLTKRYIARDLSAITSWVEVKKLRKCEAHWKQTRFTVNMFQETQPLIRRQMVPISSLFVVFIDKSITSMQTAGNHSNQKEVCAKHLGNIHFSLAIGKNCQGKMRVNDQSLGLRDWGFSSYFPKDCNQVPTTARNQLREYSFFPHGSCQKATQQSPCLCDWGLIHVILHCHKSKMANNLMSSG